MGDPLVQLAVRNYEVSRNSLQFRKLPMSHQARLKEITGNRRDMPTNANTPTEVAEGLRRRSHARERDEAGC
jgi:hypothetical protein